MSPHACSRGAGSYPSGNRSGLNERLQAACIALAIIANRPARAIQSGGGMHKWVLLQSAALIAASGANANDNDKAEAAAEEK